MAEGLDVGGCSACGRADEMYVCLTCFGNGDVVIYANIDRAPWDGEDVDCPDCGGTGACCGWCGEHGHGEAA